MTGRDGQLVDYVTRYWTVNGKGPTYREISAELGISVSSAYRVASRLRSKMQEEKPRKRQPRGVAMPARGQLVHVVFTGSEIATIEAAASIRGQDVSMFVREAAVSIADLDLDTGAG